MFGSSKPPAWCNLAKILEKARWLSELLKLEFIYRNDAPFEDIVSDLLERLKSVGVIVEEQGLLHIGLKKKRCFYR